MNFEFVAGDIALDFVATIAERHTTRLERLTTPKDLAAWVVGAGLLDSEPAVTATQLSSARELREAVYALVIHLTGGPAPNDDDRRLLNRYAAAKGIQLRLDRRWRTERRGGIEAALGQLARHGLRLAAEAPPGTIRWCAGTECTRPFIDHSHAGRRRWCGMSTCGDKAKAAAYRARRRATTVNPSR